MSCHSLLAFRVSVEKSADSLMGVPLYVIYHFSFVAFNILSLIFVSLISMYLSVFLLGFILPGTLCAAWTWLTISFPVLGTFSAIISLSLFFSYYLFKYFPRSFLSLFSFYDPYNVNAFNVVPEVS